MQSYIQGRNTVRCQWKQGNKRKALVCDINPSYYYWLTAGYSSGVDRLGDFPEAITGRIRGSRFYRDP